MLLQPRKLIPEVPATSPADKVSPQIPLAARMSPHIVLCQREVFQGDEKGRGEAVVVFAMLEAVGEPVPGDHVDVQVRHGWVRVDADHQLGFPVASAGEVFRGRFEGVVAGLVLRGELAEFSLEFFRREGLDPGSFFTALGEEGGVGEGLEGVEVVFGGVAGEDEQVDLRFREEVVDHDEGGGGGNDLVAIGGGIEDVDAEAVAVLFEGGFGGAVGRRSE